MNLQTESEVTEPRQGWEMKGAWTGRDLKEAASNFGDGGKWAKLNARCRTRGCSDVTSFNPCIS